MKNRTKYWLVGLSAVLSLVALGACGESSDDHQHAGDDDHGHGDGHHGHGEGAIAITQWGEHSELFAEYAPLVVGSPSETAIHVTDLADFSAVTVGSITVELKQADGSLVTARAEAPARPGIFTPPVAPTVAGACQLTFAIVARTWSERFTADSCAVTAKPPVHADEEEESGISFLKEQQWKIEFATVVVGERAMHKTVRVNAEIKPITGREAHLTAAIGGRVQFSGATPIIGMAIEKGQLMATVTPPLTGAINRASLQAEVAATLAEVEGARAETERVARLVAEDAIAERRVRETATRLSVAESRLKAARERLREYDVTASGRSGSGNAFRVRSPIGGTLVAVDVTSGETVAGGAHLFTVIDMRKVWIEGRVFEPDIPSVVDAREASFWVEGYDQPFSVNATPGGGKGGPAGDTSGDAAGRLVALGQVLDPRNRTVPIIFEVDNDERRLRIGQFARLEVSAGEPVPQLAVPSSAVLSDGGRPVVFVHRDGETFERRLVRVGLKAAGWVQILAGVSAGERVVSRGAHTVKLAAAATSAPAHGHAH